MRPETPLDAAFRAQEADPDPALRLRFHERVLDAELLVPLAAAAGDTLDPQVFDLEDGRFVLAFDRDDRLADFVGAPTDFAALSGRRLAPMLAGRGIGIALNLGAPSATLLPAAAVDWLAAMVRPVPEARDGRLAGLAAPDVPEALRAALAAKLAAMADAIATAHLVAASDGGGPAGAVLVLAGVPEAARARGRRRGRRGRALHRGGARDRPRLRRARQPRRGGRRARRAAARSSRAAGRAGGAPDRVRTRRGRRGCASERRDESGAPLGLVRDLDGQHLELDGAPRSVTVTALPGSAPISARATGAT